MKNHRHDDSGTRITERKTPKKLFKKPNNSYYKEDEITEEESQSIFEQKNKLIDVTCYCCGKPKYIFPYCSDS